MKSPIYRVVISAFVLLITGCSSLTTVGGNGVTEGIKMPRLDTVNKIVKLEIKESITGYGCSDGKNFLDLGKGFDLDSKEDRAKAAAAYDALFGDLKDHPPVYHEKKLPFPNDILIAPTYHYEIRETTFDSEMCAVVVGYRGKIKSIKDGSTSTADPDASQVDQVVNVNVDTADEAEIVDMILNKTE